MSTNSKPSSDYPSLNGKTGWLQRIAEYLLSLPRSVKRAILLTTDLVASIVCLFLALSLRYGDIAHNISPIILLSYGTLPIVGLYLIGFYKGVARGFVDTVMGSVAKLFFLLMVVCEIVVYLNRLEDIRRSVPIIVLCFFFFCF